MHVKGRRSCVESLLAQGRVFWETFTSIDISVYHIIVPLSGQQQGEIETICLSISFFPVILFVSPLSKQRWCATEGSVVK